MQRPPRPEPTRISAYFFQQLTAHAETIEATATALSASAGAPDRSTAAASDAAPPTTVSTTPSAPTTGADGATVAVVAAAAATAAAPHVGSARADAGAPARVTPDAAADALLWRDGTPSTFRHTFVEFMQQESARTESLRRAVTAAWEDVERQQHRNSARRAALDDLLADGDAAAWRAEVRGRLYWDAADIVQRYGFEVGVDSATTTGAAAADDGGERIQLDFAPVHSCTGGGSGGGDEEEEEDDDGAGRVAATARSATTAAELLDPCARPHFLRRIFAPLQRARASLPAWATLLLRDLHEVQTSALPDLEKRVRELVLFKVPLHRPFFDARAALWACVDQQRSAPAVEAARVTAFRQLERHGLLWTEFVAAHAPAAAAVAAAASAEQQMREGGLAVTTTTAAAAAEADGVMDLTHRWATAEALWTLLLDELDTCKSFFADAIPSHDAVRANVAAEAAAVARAVDEHRRRCTATSAAMSADAAACAELLHRNGRRIVAAVAEMEDTFAEERDRLAQAITDGAARLRRLEEQQEKSARRVREALKALFTEQLQYEEAAQALLQDQLTLAQLEASHGQLRKAVELRHHGAVEGKRYAAVLMRLLDDGTVAVRKLFSACDAHCRRVAHDDYFTRCRLVDQCTAAVQQRCRCVHAMAALYEQRYAALEARTGNAWEREFLLSGERDWAVANLRDVRAEMALVEHDWRQVCALRAELDLEPAPLDAHRGTDEWRSLMSTLRHLDAPPSLQRRLPTLKTHTTAIAAATAAAGCGPKAARHLQRDQAAISFAAP
ncbi:hypothetical protein NESM_000405800 [Novymonas esmeraldas]|uniref:DUF349 domain-containing protein n=1 Tax=Novymonas esmeraldas TaxID=1808958 RepID=A0AAW0ENQ9_9TRYP